MLYYIQDYILYFDLNKFRLDRHNTRMTALFFPTNAKRPIFWSPSDKNTWIGPPKYKKGPHV